MDQDLKDQLWDEWYDLTAGEESQRKLLYGVSALLVFLFLVVIHLITRSIGTQDDTISALLAGTFLAIVTCGLPVVLCPLTAESLIMMRRTERFFYILNNVVAVLGIVLWSFGAYIFYDSIQKNLHSPREDSFYLYALIGIDLCHILSLVFSLFFKKITEV